MNNQPMNPITVLAQLCYQAHQTAVLHGFYEPEPSVDQRVCLMHSELSEYYEGYRKGKHDKPDEHCPTFSNEEIELADLCIRVFDFAEHRKVRLGEAILAKMEYNKSRPYKHGKNF